MYTLVKIKEMRNKKNKKRGIGFHMFDGGFVRPADEYLNLIPKKQGSALKAYKNPPIKKQNPVLRKV